MVLFPNGKINLGLHVTRKREDGYHDLETVFYPVPVKDVLEVVRSGHFTFALTGLPVNGQTDNNLCVKAYQLLQKDFPGLPPVSIHLHKAIPMGAGLGGGSADGAFLLSMLNQKFHLHLTSEQLISYALQLGSDCPFFIINKPCFATGRGEVLSPVGLDLKEYRLVLVNPGIHVSTREAFSTLTAKVPTRSLQDIICQPVAEWKEVLKNDFEEPVFRLYPAIEKIKFELYEAGAVYASMTGSGSTVFGIFRTDTNLELPFPAHQLLTTTG
jgi:4-diphosphocytidyl-2-C-methyl-D-erythritol kinase